MLRTRLILGPFLILGILLLAWGDEALEASGAAPGVLLMPVFLLVAALASHELVAITRLRRVHASLVLTSIAAMLGMSVAGAIAGEGWVVEAVGTLARSIEPEDAGRLGGAIVATTATLILCASLAWHARNKSAEGVLAATGVTIFAFVYLGLMGGFLLLIRREHSAWVLLSVLLITKSFDIGAYFAGRQFGRTKLIAWLSPGKTWEGVFGGLFVAGFVAALATILANATQIGITLVWWQGALIGVLFGAIGQAGDLLASLLKRDAGVKDASRALPGFGGVLDVIDSPLLVAPVAYWLLLLVS